MNDDLKRVERQANKYKREEHELIRRFDSKKITKKKYESQMLVVLSALRTLTLEQVRLKSLMLVKVEKIKKTNEKKVTAENKKNRKITKENPDTLLSVIASALMLKSTKNMNQVIKIVKSKKPNFTKDKLITNVKLVISMTRNGRGRWSRYQWSDKEYLLSSKNQDVVSPKSKVLPVNTPKTPIINTEKKGIYRFM
jgi:hypothetical protein